MQEDRTFNPIDFLQQFYRNPSGSQEQDMGRFQEQQAWKAFDIIPESESCLQIGSGPVLNIAACASRKCKNIYLTDFNLDSFDHIKKELSRKPDDKDSFWAPRFQVIAKFEGITKQKVAQRVKQRITACFKCDLNKDELFDIPYLKKVQVIVSSLTMESAAVNFEHYERILQNFRKYLKPQGGNILCGEGKKTPLPLSYRRYDQININQKQLQNNKFQHSDLGSHLKNYIRQYRVFCSFNSKCILKDYGFAIIYFRFILQNIKFFMLQFPQLRRFYNYLSQRQFFEKQKMKKYPTQYQKRKLLYEKRLKEQQKAAKKPLQLPNQYKTKISQAQYKKIKQAFYIESTCDVTNDFYTLNRQQFVKLVRSLGIVSKTASLYQQFNLFYSKTIGWQQFLKIYLNVRTQKGSYNQLNHALTELNKQYRGDWQLLEEDLMTIGDVLSEKQMNVFYNEIIGDKPFTQETLLNVLLGYK